MRTAVLLAGVVVSACGSEPACGDSLLEAGCSIPSSEAGADAVGMLQVRMDFPEHDPEAVTNGRGTGRDAATSAAHSQEGSEGSEAPPPPVLALLFMTEKSLVSAPPWLAWLRQAKSAGIEPKIFIHTSGLEPPSNANLFEPAEFRPYVVNFTRPTGWCEFGIVNTTMELALLALADATVTHLAVVSDTHIPTMPLATMHAMLAQKPNGRFCGDGPLGDKAQFHTAYTEMWWVLPRVSVSFAIAHQHAVKERAAEKIKELGEHCYDEEFWSAGEEMRVKAAELAGAASLRPDLTDCTTLTLWGKSFHEDPRTLAAWSLPVQVKKCNCPALIPLPVHESSQIRFANPIWEHPATIHRVSLEAYKQLLTSGFWFMRKVTADAVNESAAEAVFA